MSKQGVQTKSKSAQASPSKAQDVPPSSETEMALDHIFNAMKVLAPDHDLQRIWSRLNQISVLENEIRVKSDQVNKLSDHIKEITADHAKSHRRSLCTYDDAKDELKREITMKNESITSLQERVNEQDDTIARIKDSVSHKENLVGNLQKTLEAQAKKGEKIENKMKELKQSCTDMRVDNEKLKKILQQNRGEITKLDDELKRSQAAYESLDKDYQESARELQSMKSFTTQLDEGNIDENMEKVNQVFARAAHLISATFFKELPDEVIKNDTIWKSLIDTGGWKNRPPFPPSNSEVAQQMRVVVVLASLIQTMDHHIFQPTYLLPAESGIRALLSRQAVEDDRRESFFRSLLLSLRSGSQATETPRRIAQACDEVLQRTRGVLSDIEETRFRAGLKEIMEAACSTWQQVLRSRNAVEPIFTTHYPDDKWGSFRFEGKQLVFDSNGGYTDAGGNEDAIVVLAPQLYMVEEGYVDPLDHGVAMMRSQLAAAYQELAQLTAPSVVGRNNTGTAQYQRSRRPSSSVQQPFLPFPRLESNPVVERPAE